MMKGRGGNAPSVPADTETFKISGPEDLRDELLPSIPNNITLQVIAPKLSGADINMLSLVNRSWQEAIHRRWVYDARVRSHSTETFVALLYHDDSDDEENCVRDYGLRLYSLNEHSVHRLPPIPSPDRILYGCECIPLDGKIYILGGQISESRIFNRSCSGSRELFMLDLAGHKPWKQCASMQEGRHGFGAGVLDGKIYVIGGRDENKLVHKCEVYDPKVDSWSSIADMIPYRIGHRVVAIGSEIFVYRGMERAENSPYVFYPRYVVAYNPVKNEWRQLGHHETGDELAAILAEGHTDTGLDDNPWVHAFVAHGKFHTFVERNGMDLRLYDAGTDSWSCQHSYSIQSLFEGNIKGWAFGNEYLMREYLRNYIRLDGRYGSRGNSRLRNDLYRKRDGMCFIQV